MCGQVRAHAVEVLKRTENEELLYYLLQLVQALRYEAADDSRLAAFLVQRAISDPTLAIFLHWCATPCRMECRRLLILLLVFRAPCGMHERSHAVKHVEQRRDCWHTSPAACADQGRKF